MLHCHTSFLVYRCTGNLQRPWFFQSKGSITVIRWIGLDCSVHFVYKTVKYCYNTFHNCIALTSGSPGFGAKRGTTQRHWGVENRGSCKLLVGFGWSPSGKQFLSIAECLLLLISHVYKAIFVLIFLLGLGLLQAPWLCSFKLHEHTLVWCTKITKYKTVRHLLETCRTDC